MNDETVKRLQNSVLKKYLAFLEGMLYEEGLTHDTYDWGPDLDGVERAVFESFEGSSESIDLQPRLKAFTTEDAALAERYEDLYDKVVEKIDAEDYGEEQALAIQRLTGVDIRDLRGDFDAAFIDNNLDLFRAVGDSGLSVGEVSRGLLCVYEGAEEEVKGSIKGADVEDCIRLSFSKAARSVLIKDRYLAVDDLLYAINRLQFMDQVTEETNDLLEMLGAGQCEFSSLEEHPSTGLPLLEVNAQTAGLLTVATPVVLLDLARASRLFENILVDAKKAQKELEKRIKKAVKERETIHRYDGGGSEVFNFSKIEGPEQFYIQGEGLGQCVDSHEYYKNRVAAGDAEIYSMHTPSGKLKFTFYWEPLADDTGVKYSEILGKANRMPEKPAEARALIDFVENYLEKDPRDFDHLVPLLAENWSRRRRNPSAPSLDHLTPCESCKRLGLRSCTKGRGTR